MPRDQLNLNSIRDLVPKREHQRVQDAKAKVPGAFRLGGDIISTSVSAKKISDARGTRAQCLTQKDVMGGVSATKVRPSKLRWITSAWADMAKVAEKLGWVKATERIQKHNQWPGTGCFPAEVCMAFKVFVVRR